MTIFVLALLGDNPMQSEFACHAGLRAKFFCRICMVKGKDLANTRDRQGQENIAAMIERIKSFMKVESN